MPFYLTCSYQVQLLAQNFKYLLYFKSHINIRSSKHKCKHYYWKFSHYVWSVSGKHFTLMELWTHICYSIRLHIQGVRRMCHYQSFTSHCCWRSLRRGLKLQSIKLQSEVIIFINVKPCDEPVVHLEVRGTLIHNNYSATQSFKTQEVRGTATAAINPGHEVNKSNVPVVSPAPLPFKTGPQKSLRLQRVMETFF